MSEVESKRKKRTSEMLTTPTVGRDHTNQEHPPWSRLPATALFAIYQNLGDFDRLSMATVCQSWYQGFQVAALWRKRFFKFGGPRTKEEMKCDALMKPVTKSPSSYGKDAIKFAEQFPTNLHHIVINFKLIHDQDAEEIVDDFKEFCTCLDGAKLRSISFPYLDVDKDSVQIQKELVDPLKRLLHNQRSLRKFEINSSYFDLETGLQIIQCLAEASAATIEDLSLDCFFLNGLSLYREERVLKELKKFTGLSRIEMAYDVISEELAKSWVTGCPHLSSIYLYADEYVHRAHVISHETWTSLVSSHPHLLVELRASLQDVKEIPDILSSAIPMFNLSWDTYREVTTLFELTRLLYHVANYHRTIKHLYLGLLGQFPNLDTTAVQNMLSKCKHLLPFKCKNCTRSLTNDHSWSLSQDTWWR